MNQSSFREHPVRWIFSIVAAIVLVPILVFVGTYVWVHNANNAAAKQIEARLLTLKTPDHTELVDSSWAVSRFAGGGNGTHQAAALLIRSNLNREALDSFYEAQPGDQRVIATTGDELRGESRMFNEEHDLRQPGLFMVFAYVEPESVLLHDYDLRGH